ncbi:hypothetical protein CYMTET_11223 [Cymbomonas tetramitiformis]|uniref:RRM domain-containing protein n=1 Tax=Cymbomonas tetramitiformis TaxID=36881 RepID=A0AAE0FI87_9CHLO|nr:hypothetical protein CYMTET_30732 [Cymbomonas tetramitiformis]KAK3280960.1 hypothetical protein CYMTET_11223 [Cymbomonas tetramitiformis]
MAKVYIGNLEPGVTERDLEEDFSKYGTMRSVWVARKPAGFAFIEFQDERDAEDALQRTRHRPTLQSTVQAVVTAGGSRSPVVLTKVEKEARVAVIVIVILTLDVTDAMAEAEEVTAVLENGSVMNAETLGTSRGTAVNGLIVREVVVVAVTAVTVAVMTVAVTVAGPQAHGVEDHQRADMDDVAAAVLLVIDDKMFVLGLPGSENLIRKQYPCNINFMFLTLLFMFDVAERFNC